MNNDDKKITVSDDDQELVAPSGAVAVRESVEYAVETNIVRDVDDANYNQAERTIDALEKANMSTKHALNGLHDGHGYEIESYVIKAPVQMKDKQIGETIYGENHLVSYSLKDGIYQVERKDQLLIESQSGGSSNLPAVTNQSLQTLNTQPQNGKTIEINAISRKTVKQVESPDGLTKKGL